MQNSMNREVGGLFVEVAPRGERLARGGIDGNHDIAE